MSKGTIITLSTILGSMLAIVIKLNIPTYISIIIMLHTFLSTKYLSLLLSEDN